MRIRCLLALCACAASASAQPVSDSTDARTPRGAVTRALLAPGLGQVYNRQPVKAPIAAGLVVGAIVYAVDRQRRYVRLQRATIFAGCEEGPNDTPERIALCTEDAPGFEDEWRDLGQPRFSTVRPVRDRARGQRDIGFLLVGVAYAIQALDAYVAAELSDFDVSEDLTLRLRPGGQDAVALRVRL
ncbi:MAG: DUF5683 domain-containing protein [Bacteroidota bacterium]